MNASYDVVIVGSGPNGLAAGIVAARCGLDTIIIEGTEQVGGGARSAELTLPGFMHDVCSAVQPMGVASPLFRELPLADFGLQWITPPVAAAHPLDQGPASLLANSLDETVGRLGPDGSRYRSAIGHLAAHWSDLADDILRPIGIPRHPLRYTRFGLKALLPARTFARSRFQTEAARALFAGNAAHSIIPLTSLGSAAIGLVLAAVAHVYGWPVPQGGSGAIAASLAGYFQSLGGTIVTGHMVTRRDQLPNARAYLFDTSPRAAAAIMRDRLPAGFADRLRGFRYGPGAFKVDWALSQPIPWRDPDCLRAGTVHVGGTLDEIAASEAAAWTDTMHERPFVLVTQPSLCDPSRAPDGRHTAWGYCHVPHGSPVDMTERIERQIERFAPGFRDVILARHTRSPAMLEAENPNLVGGDLGGGSNHLFDLLLRPTWRHYATPAPDVYLCSAATPPGGGVHGMCGLHAARRAITRQFGADILARAQLTSA